MLHRYLKFHRLYSIEVFVAYADSPPILATDEKGERKTSSKVNTIKIIPFSVPEYNTGGY
jgi:hypothetical protein